GPPAAGNPDSKKDTGQRVVLLEFPMAGQKSIGFLTHMVTDSSSGAVLASVLIPKAINPSSALLQFVPLDRITETDHSMDQDLSLPLAVGAFCPYSIRYSTPEPAAARKEDGSILVVNG